MLLSAGLDLVFACNQFSHFFRRGMTSRNKATFSTKSGIFEQGYRGEQCDIALSLIASICLFCFQNKHYSHRFVLLQSNIARPWVNLFSAAPKNRPRNRPIKVCHVPYVMTHGTWWRITSDAHRKMKVINTHAKRKITFSGSSQNKSYCTGKRSSVFTFLSARLV